MRKFWQKKYVSKYTGKEIDDAVAKAGTALQNPMTAAGDLIVGGTDGAAGKLAKGTDGKVLKMVSGAPAWADDSQGMVNPMTTAGDIIVGGTDGAADRLAKGTDGQVLSMVSGAPAWAAAGGGIEHLYLHGLVITGSSYGGPGSIIVTASVITSSATPWTITDLRTFLGTSESVVLPVNGIVDTSNSGTNNVALYIKATTDSLLCMSAKFNSTTHKCEVNTTTPNIMWDYSNPTLTDTVKQIM